MVYNFLCSVNKRNGLKIPQIIYLFKSQDGHTEQSKFWMDKIKRHSPNHVFVQKSRWLFSMQSKFEIDKIQGRYKVGVVICLALSGYIFTSSKKGNGLLVG